jgi:hypothetical protein
MWFGSLSPRHKSIMVVPTIIVKYLLLNSQFANEPTENVSSPQIITKNRLADAYSEHANADRSLLTRYKAIQDATLQNFMELT